ncbi:MAG TPA: glycine betaine ABC transporter substrate-binding protein [Bacteroidales bacterium]|nr:glycine betaine ABC transporter substrate-binding protein [Bacteroidales bacterium]
MKKSISNIFAIMLIGLFTIGISSCDSGKKGDDKGNESKGELEILYPNWAEGVAFTHLAKVALEDQGYQVKITPIEPGMIYASLAKGDSDLFFDAWLPNTHSDYWEKYGDDLTKLGESFSGGTTGLVVPSYVEVNSISELNDHAEEFNNEIIGIGSGAGIHRNTQKAIDTYELDFEQITSSGPAMLASLEKALNKKEPVVITGWKPHYMWAQYDIKYLEDPKGVYPKDVCAILSRKGFEEDYPQAAKFCNNFNLKEEQLYSLMGKIKDASDPLVAAQEWYEDHKTMVDNWYPAEKETKTEE